MNTFMAPCIRPGVLKHAHASATVAEERAVHQVGLTEGQRPQRTAQVVWIHTERLDGRPAASNGGKASLFQEVVIDREHCKILEVADGGVWHTGEFCPREDSKGDPLLHHGASGVSHRDGTGNAILPAHAVPAAVGVGPGLAATVRRIEERGPCTALRCRQLFGMSPNDPCTLMPRRGTAVQGAVTNVEDGNLMGLRGGRRLRARQCSRISRAAIVHRASR